MPFNSPAKTLSLRHGTKTGFEPAPLYGKELDRLITELTEFFSQKAPVIKKYLDLLRGEGLLKETKKGGGTGK